MTLALSVYSPIIEEKRYVHMTDDRHGAAIAAVTVFHKPSFVMLTSRQPVPDTIACSTCLVVLPLTGF